MAQRVVVWEDFSGGHYAGGNDARQPMNTWRGVDVDISPSTGYLLRRDENLYPSGVLTATSQSKGSSITASSWNWSSYSTPSLTNETQDHTCGAPVACEGAFTTSGSPATPTAGELLHLFWWNKGGSSQLGGTCNFMSWHTGWSRAQQGGVITGYPTGEPIAFRGSSAGQVRAAAAYWDQGGGAPGIALYESLFVAHTSITPPTTMGQLGVWDEFLVAAQHQSQGGHLLYFTLVSSIGTTWYNYQIGDRSPIYAFVVDRDRLLIGKRDGWYVFTGDPADVDTVTIRRITNAVGPAVPPYTPTKRRRTSTSRLDNGGVLFPPYVGAKTATAASNFGGGVTEAIGRIGLRRLSGATVTEELVTQYNPSYTSAAGIFAGCDACQILAVTPDAPTGSYPYQPDEIAHWIRKGERWFHWSTDGLPSGSVPVSDMRVADSTARDVILFLTSPTPAGAQLTYALTGLNAYSDLPTSWKPILVELAPYQQAQPFTVKSVFVEFDYGPLQLSTGSGYYGLAKCAVQAGIVGVDAEDIAWSENVTVEKEVVGGLDGADGDNLRRKQALVKLLPTNLPAGNEVTLQVTLGGARLRRVVMVIDEEPWPS